MPELIPSKVHYHFFDKSFPHSTHLYGKYRATTSSLLEEIQHNEEAIVKYTQAKRLVILQQIHGNQVIDADNLTDFSIEPQADAVITSQAQLTLAIQTADCVPLLVASTDGKIIGAAHCGWKGAKNQIVTYLIELMRAKGARHFKAVIGPAIQAASYEVNQQFYEDFLAQGKHEHLFYPSNRKDHYRFNLPGFVANQLQQNNVEDILDVKINTYTSFDRYPSYRHACHLGKEEPARLLSTIFIQA